MTDTSFPPAPVRGSNRDGILLLLVVAVLGLAAFAAGVGSRVSRGGGEEEAEGAFGRGPSGSGAPAVCTLEDDAILASFGSPLTIRDETGARIPASLGTLVRRGATVAVAPGAEAIFFTARGPLEIAWDGERRLQGFESAAPRLGGFWPRLLSLHSAKRDRLAALLEPRALDAAPSGLRIESPIGKLLVARPAVAWRDDADGYPYSLRLRTRDSVLFETSVRERTKGAMRAGFPKDPPLERGIPYVLEIVSSDGRIASCAVELASEEEERRVREPMRAAAGLLRNVVACHVLAAYWYWNEGFVQQAAGELAMLARQRPIDRFPLECQLVMQFEAGNGALARDVARKLGSLPAASPKTVRPAEPPPARD